MQTRKGIVLIVKNKNEELLLLKQKTSGDYSFISGGIEEGENPKVAVIREAKEEVGLKINPDKLIETEEKIKFTGSKKGPAEQKVFIYQLENNQNLKADDFEISGYEWCSKRKALEKLKNKPPLVKLVRILEPSLR